MTTNRNDDVIYSRVNLNKIAEHKNMFGIPDDQAALQMMPLSEYQAMVSKEAFFFVDHNGFLRHQFSGEILAASKEHIDILISHLKDQRKLLEGAVDCSKE